MKKCLLFLSWFLFSLSAFAHPFDNATLAFAVADNKVSCQLRIPLEQLQFAVDFNVTSNTDVLLKNHSNDLQNYIEKHFQIKGESGTFWQMKILNVRIENTSDKTVKLHKDIFLEIVFQPNQKERTRIFTIYYDAVIHQLITHKAIVSINQDWENGNVGHHDIQVGIIGYNQELNAANPLVISLQAGSNWTGFKAMFWLGVDHIADGVDHLMFLLLLLLPAPLVVIANKWQKNQSNAKSFIKILKIVTGFTIGHSVTLFIGTMQWFEMPVLIVEVVVAASIFITGIHALKPIFYKREMVVAISFGLIHGLAFSQTLVDLNLSSGKLLLSLLGFNLGVETMQLFVILAVMPFLVYLSGFTLYQFIRIFFATVGLIASAAWITELLTDQSNSVTDLLALIPVYAHWLVVVLISVSVIHFICVRKIKGQKRR